jgi:hypothetical protein
MKRVRRILTHKRHWLWYGVSGASMLAGAVSQVVSADAHPVAFVALSVLSGAGGLVAHWCAPDERDDA